MEQLELKPCNDCGRDVPFFSKKFDMTLCRDCWNKREDLDTIEGMERQFKVNLTS